MRKPSMNDEDPCPTCTNASVEKAGVDNVSFIFCESGTSAGTWSLYKNWDDLKHDRPLSTWTVDDDDTEEDVKRKIIGALCAAVEKAEEC